MMASRVLGSLLAERVQHILLSDSPTAAHAWNTIDK